MRHVKGGSLVPVLVSVMLTLSSFRAWAKAPAPMTAKGKDFTIRVPAGYHVAASDPVVTKGGVALVSDATAPAPAAGLVSIVVSPIPPEDAKPDFTKLAACAKGANEVAAAAHITMQRAVIVKLPAGKACQFSGLLQRRPHRAARFTVLRSPTTLWVMTCNHDDRDKRALKACDSALRAWRFTK